MSLSFPVSPSVGQAYQQFQWDGAKWVPNPAASNLVSSYNGRTGAVVSQPGDDTSGNLALLSKQVVAAAVASVTFNALLTSAYDDYEVHLTGMQCSVANTSALMQVSADGGTTWLAGTNYAGAIYYVVSQGSPLFGNVSSSALAAWQLGTAMDITTGYNLNVRARLFRPRTTLVKFIMAEAVAINSSGGVGRSMMGGTANIGAYDSIRVNPNNGNWTAGTVELYGKVK